MLDDPGPGSRREQTGPGRQVQAAGIVPSGAYGIHGRRTLRNRWAQREITHCGGESADFLGRFALRTQSSQQRACERSIHFAGRKRVHQPGGFGFA